MQCIRWMVIWRYLQVRICAGGQKWMRTSWTLCSQIKCSYTLFSLTRSKPTCRTMCSQFNVVTHYIFSLTRSKPTCRTMCCQSNAVIRTSCSRTNCKRTNCRHFNRRGFNGHQAMSYLSSCASFPPRKRSFVWFRALDSPKQWDFVSQIWKRLAEISFHIWMYTCM
jgi:hypothetical protein